MRIPAYEERYGTQPGNNPCRMCGEYCGDTCRPWDGRIPRQPERAAAEREARRLLMADPAVRAKYDQILAVELARRGVRSC